MKKLKKYQDFILGNNRWWNGETSWSKLSDNEIKKKMKRMRIVPWIYVEPPKWKK